jgi:hypothetical protein
MRTRLKTIMPIVAASALLFAVPAAGVDGEILINQAKANAGGVTPGDASGFPVTLSRPGRYKLSGNLGVPAGEVGIEVTARDVTINFNGFTMSSTVSSSQPAVGISARDIAGLRVMKGTITGFGSAAILNDGLGSAFTVIENMRIVNNISGIGIGENVRVLNSTVANNTNGGGIICRSGCAIENNVITGNGGHGIAMWGGGVVLGNVIVANTNFGLVVSNGSSGYGNNVLVGNGQGPRVGNTIELHPNACSPACP